MNSAPRPGGRTAVRRVASAAALVLALSGAAWAQVQRPFPPTALRGTLVVGQTPEVAIDGRPARLAPGSRIRNRDNLLELPGSLTGQRLDVHYTRDFDGSVKDVWILTPEELARRPWPRTPEEAARWTYDPATQTWSK